MQSSQPIGSPLMGIFLILAIAVFLYSPKMLRTLGWMFLAFWGAALLIMIPAAVAHRGAPEVWGKIAAEVGMVIAPAAGCWHIRLLKRASKKAEASPSSGL